MSDKTEETKVNLEEIRLARLRENAAKARAKRAQNAEARRKAKEEEQKALEYYSEGESEEEVEVEDAEDSSETESSELPPPPPPILTRQTGGYYSKRSEPESEASAAESDEEEPRKASGRGTDSAAKKSKASAKKTTNLPELPPKRKPGRPKGSTAKSKAEYPSETSLRQAQADLYEEMKQVKKRTSLLSDKIFNLTAENEKLKKELKGGKAKKTPAGNVKIVHNTITTPPPTAKPKTDEEKKELANVLKLPIF